MRGIGFAHTDIKLDNVFVDSDGDAFIGDLEYLTDVDGPPRRDAPGTTIGMTVTGSARDQDMIQLEMFATAVYTN